MGKSVAILIYELVRKIPRGKVTTYGAIALRLRSGPAAKITPLMVGRALHHNPDPAGIPCHRVVDRNGRLAINFAFGGWKEQKRKLLEEGIKFKDEMHVSLKYIDIKENGGVK